MAQSVERAIILHTFGVQVRMIRLGFQGQVPGATDHCYCRGLLLLLLAPLLLLLLLPRTSFHLFLLLLVLNPKLAQNPKP